MSLLGGADRMLQFNLDAVRQLVIGAVQIGGNALVPEFQLTVPGDGDSQPIIDCIVSNVTVSITPNTPQVVIELQGSAVIALPGQSVIAIGTGVTLQLLGTLQQSNAMALQLTTFRYANPYNLQTAAIPDFQNQMDGALASLVALNTPINLLTAQATASNDVKGETQVFIAALDPHATDANNLVAHDGGDGSANCLLEGQNIALALGAEWLSKNVLCRQLTNPPIGPFGSTAALPPMCSTSGGPLKQTSKGQDIYIDSIAFTFLEGSIVISGVFHCSGECWSVTGGTFSYPLTLALSADGGSVIPTLDTSSNPIYDVDVDFLCRLASFVGGLIVGGLGFLAGSFVALFAGTLGKSLFGAKPDAPNTQTSSIPTLSNIRWTSLRITPEGLIVGGVLSIPESLSTFFPNVVIAATPPTYTTTRDLGTGSFTVSSPLCGNATFSYSRLLRNQVSPVVATCTGLLGRVTYAWSVDDSALNNVVGTLQLPMTVSTAVPPPDGTPVPGHLTTIDWFWGTPFAAANDTASLTLTSHAADLNYTLHVRLVATDQVGRAVSSDIAVNVVGDSLEFPDNSYENYERNCLNALIGLIHRTRTKIQIVPIGGDPGEREKRERQLIDAVVQLFSEGTKEGRIAFEALYALKGSAVLKAMSAPSEVVASRIAPQ